MDELRKLQQRLNELVKRLRDTQTEEAPDANKVDGIEKEIREIAGHIETERAILRAQEGFDGTEQSPEAKPKLPGAEGRSGEEHRSAMLHYMRTGDPSELRDMTGGTSGSGGDTGGYLVPESWANEIIKKIREQFVMRNICTIQTSDTDRHFPVEAAAGTSVWIDEGAAYTASDARFSTLEIGAHKLGRIVKVSEELLQDNAYNLEGYLTGAFAYSNGLAEETAFISGNGVKKPRGFILDAQVGVTAELHDEIAYEEILDLYASLEAAYDFGARWLVNKGTLVEIMKMKDGAGQYIYHASTLPGELGHILGALVTISSLMPPIAALAKPLAYGNFKNYLIQDRLGFLLQRLDEVYAGNGFIGFRGRSRVDGRLLIPESIKVLAMAAAPSSSS